MYCGLTVHYIFYIKTDNIYVYKGGTMQEKLTIKGARENNLKNVDLEENDKKNQNMNQRNFYKTFIVIKEGRKNQI